MTIDPEAVHHAFLDCLFSDEEVANQVVGVKVDGIRHAFAFHPERLETHREDVRQWLRLLPTPFRKGSGGGWSFLNACAQADGTLWTGEHQSVEQLLTLGIALGYAKWCLKDRDLWAIMPGGMPYVQLDGLES